MPGPSFLTVWPSRNQMVSIGLSWRSASVPAMQTWNGYGLSTQWMEFSSILVTLANTPLVRFLWILGLLPSCLVCHLENCKLAHLRQSSLRPQTMETNGVTKCTTWVIHVDARGTFWWDQLKLLTESLHLVCKGCCLDPSSHCTRLHIHHNRWEKAKDSALDAEANTVPDMFLLSFVSQWRRLQGLGHAPPTAGRLPASELWCSPRPVSGASLLLTFYFLFMIFSVFPVQSVNHYGSWKLSVPCVQLSGPFSVPQWCTS